MADETTINTILRTKLYRPPAPGDYVHRPRLLEYLDQRRKRLLTLVSAPAGYGKSVLISNWLETYENFSAWLSLDEQDNDLRLFLSYFLVAGAAGYRVSLPRIRKSLRKNSGADL